MLIRNFLRGQWRCRHCLREAYSTSPSNPNGPPLLLKLREDLKTAMRAKDANRLNVIRSLINDINNASKFPNKPVSTDVQILSLLRKRIASSKTAVEEFARGGKQELVHKEEQQIALLDGYAGDVPTLADEEIRTSVEEAINSLSQGQNPNKGAVIRRLLGPDGLLANEPVEKGNVIKAVDAALENGKG